MPSTQVIAAAVVFIIGNLLLGALRLLPGHAFDRPTHHLAPGPLYYASRFDLHTPESARVNQPHLQRHGRRIFCRDCGKGLRMNKDASFYNAKRLYLESCGDPMVTNTYLKIALALLSIVCVLLALIDLRTIRTFQNFRPLVIRIDDLGRAEAINYHNLEYKPQDAEAKYFLSQFCTLYYRRNRYTIQDDFSKSLYFLDGKLANGILDALPQGRHHQEVHHQHRRPRDRCRCQESRARRDANPTLPRTRGLLHGLLLARRP